MPRLLAAVLGEAGDPSLPDLAPVASSASSVGSRHARLGAGGGELAVVWPEAASCPRGERRLAAASFLKASTAFYDDVGEARHAEAEAEVSREAIQDLQEQADRAHEKAEEAEEAAWVVLEINSVATVIGIGIGVVTCVIYRRWWRYKRDLVKCFNAAGGAMPGRLASGGTGAGLPPASVPAVPPAAGVPGAPPPGTASGSGPPGAPPPRRQDGTAINQ
mmetsp:Transcript_4053/g.12981  ORF Transcript_4053/g.12981 Transcript_4053/m.12981 type:complete len:219 (+) Transcript_4053:48-704(+)